MSGGLGVLFMSKYNPNHKSHKNVSTKKNPFVNYEFKKCPLIYSMELFNESKFDSSCCCLMITFIETKWGFFVLLKC
jgi:hypothetical protein